jgi:hypothetical protein
MIGGLLFVVNYSYSSVYLNSYCFHRLSFFETLIDGRGIEYECEKFQQKLDSGVLSLALTKVTRCFLWFCVSSPH